MTSRFALVLVAACSASHAKVDLANVYVFAGDTAPYPGAELLANAADGTPFEALDADAVGYAQVPIAAGGTITAVLPGEPTAATPVITLVTVPAPAPGAELDIHGPRTEPTPSAAGVLLVQPPAFTADAFTIELGCTVTQVASFPASIDVSTLCLTTDANLDVLVLAKTGGQITGYVAGRVPLVDGFAMFQPTAWETAATTVPIANSTAAQLTWQLHADGLTFANQTVTTSAPYFNGLAASAATLVATMGSQVTTRGITGTPASIAVDAGDFLPSVTQTVTFDGAAYAWGPADIGADALDLHIEYDAPTAHIAWDIVMPPDATGVTLPTFGGDLATLVGAPPSASARLDYVAETPAVGFDALTAGGFWAGTVAPLPANGEIRTVQIAAP
jgi:hypothetical protein